METSLRNRLTYGPIMLAALLGLLWLMRVPLNFLTCIFASVLVGLTGAGGGGCMIALTEEPDRVSRAIAEAGGQPFMARMGAPGVRREGG